jgi:hypothetical protein
MSSTLPHFVECIHQLVKWDGNKHNGLALNLEQDGSTNSTIMDELNDIT